MVVEGSDASDGQRRPFGRSRERYIHHIGSSQHCRSSWTMTTIVRRCPVSSRMTTYFKNFLFVRIEFRLEFDVLQPEPFLFCDQELNAVMFGHIADCQTTGLALAFRVIYTAIDMRVQVFELHYGLAVVKLAPDLHRRHLLTYCVRPLEIVLMERTSVVRTAGGTGEPLVDAVQAVELFATLGSERVVEDSETNTTHEVVLLLVAHPNQSLAVEAGHCVTGVLLWSVLVNNQWSISDYYSRVSRGLSVSDSKFSNLDLIWLVVNHSSVVWRSSLYIYTHPLGAALHWELKRAQSEQNIGKFCSCDNRVIAFAVFANSRHSLHSLPLVVGSHRLSGIHRNAMQNSLQLCTEVFHTWNAPQGSRPSDQRLITESLNRWFCTSAVLTVLTVLTLFAGLWSLRSLNHISTAEQKILSLLETETDNHWQWLTQFAHYFWVFSASVINHRSIVFDNSLWPPLLWGQSEPTSDRQTIVSVTITQLWFNTHSIESIESLKAFRKPLENVFVNQQIWLKVSNDWNDRDTD